jgi:hypothetical protein
MKSPYCEEEWKPHKEFPPDRKVRCPNGHLIPFKKKFNGIILGCIGIIKKEKIGLLRFLYVESLELN